MLLVHNFRSAVLAAGLLAAACCLTPTPAEAQIFLSVRIAPPIIPVYVQPECPTDGYLWNPGYWAYGQMGYYWVPGVWVSPPRVGVLWTPGYWGFSSGVYGWNAGYWGPHVGFYGGVNYGFGYGGVGFIGGGWSGGSFRYNTAVMHVNTTVIHNTYVDRTVINNATVVNNRASFNGPGGATAQPTAQERQFAHEQHIQPTANQLSHQQSASQNRSNFASVNKGRPANAAMARVGEPSHNQAAAHAQPAAHMQQPAQRPGGNQQQAHAEQPHAAEAHATQPHAAQPHAAQAHAAQPHAVQAHAAPAHASAPRPAAHEAAPKQEHH